MTTVRFTIGRNVKGSPMNDCDWMSFIHHATRVMDNLFSPEWVEVHETLPGHATNHDNPEWSGETSAIITGANASAMPDKETATEALTALRHRFMQDAIMVDYSEPMFV